MAAPMEESSNIKLHDELEETGLLHKRDVCKLCLKAQAAYTCPRCNVTYCSLFCYRSEKHADCSESFYKNNFIQALKETKGSSDDKKKMLEMLARLESQELRVDSDDDEDTQASSLENRLAGLDLDAEPDKVWERLTAQEKQEFDEVLRGGALSTMLEEWTPWWTKHDRELITGLGENVQLPASKQGQMLKPPPLLDSIPSLSELIKSSPSPLIIFNLINILYCYAYFARLYNGGHADIPLHASQSFLELCTVVSANASFSSVEEAIQSAIQTITQLKSYPSERRYLISVVQDVVHISLGRSKSSPSIYVEAALSDLHMLLKKGRAICKKLPNGDQSSSDKSKAAMFQAKKKVIFYLAWARENQGAMKEKAAQLKLLHRSMEQDQAKHEQAKTSLESNMKAVRAKQSKSLIKELD